MKKIGIVGTRRRFTNSARKAIEEQLFKIYEEGDWIVSGGCPRGADRIAEGIAKSNGIPILIFYPNWKKNGRGAGLIRNAEIAKNSDVLIACVADDRKGGTEDTIKKYMRLCEANNKEEELYII